MPRTPSGLYTRPAGTTAIAGQTVTDEIFNDAFDDVASALTESATRAQLLDIAGAPISTGTGAAYAVTANAGMTALGNGTLVGFRPHVANTGPCTLTVTSAGSGGTTFPAAPLRAISGQDLSAGDIGIGSPVVAAYSPTSFSRVTTGTLTPGSVQVTGVANVVGLSVGQAVASGVAGIPSGTTIASIAGSTVTMSAAFAGAATALNAPLTFTGGEFLLLQGSLLATAARLSQIGGLAPVVLTANTTLDQSHKGKLLLCVGTIALTVASIGGLGNGWNPLIKNAGSGDVSIAATPAASFTGSVTQGSATISNLSSTSGLAVGQRVNGPSAAYTFTGNLQPGSSTILSASPTTNLAVGQLITIDRPGLPSGTTITSISGTSISLSNTFGGAAGGPFTATAGLLPGTTITAVTGSSITVSSPFTGPTTVAAAFATFGDFIDGRTGYVIYPGETRQFVGDGANALRSIVQSPFLRSYFANGDFLPPPGYARYGGLAWAGGGGANGSFGGGGGMCMPFVLTASLLNLSEPVTVGAGGAASSGTGTAGSGGNTKLGSLVTAYGGAGANSSGAGGGGGALGSGTGQAGGAPSSATNALPNDSGFGGAYGGVNTPNPYPPGSSIYGGGGGSAPINNQPIRGGASVYGGGGGGGAPGGTGNCAGGPSQFGGPGGYSNTPGFAPAGGGGSNNSGAPGQLDIWGIV